MNRISILLLAASVACAAQAPLVHEKRIALPGVKGRIDHMAFDASGMRLFVAALGNHTVEVIDVDKGAVVRELTGLHEPQGLYYWPEEKRLYAANAGDGHVVVFDAATFAVIRSYDFNADADNVRFDPAVKEVLVGHGEGALGFISEALGSRVGDAMLDAHPESFQLEAAGPRVFVNVPGEGAGPHIAVIDRRTRSVTAKWPLNGVKRNFPMALDEPSHRLFAGCREPAVMLVLDTASGREVARVPIPGDADDLFHDAARHRIYVSGGSGSVGVIAQKDADHYEPLATIPTARGARTSFFAASTGRLFVAVPQRGKGQEAEILVFAAK